MTKEHSTKKMRPLAEAPAGLETDGKGDAIPFSERTEEDQEKAKSALRDRMHEDASIKNPENELAAPGAMPKSQQSQGSQHKPLHDPEGQQGGTYVGGRETR